MKTTIDISIYPHIDNTDEGVLIGASVFIGEDSDPLENGEYFANVLEENTGMYTIPGSTPSISLKDRTELLSMYRSMKQDLKDAIARVKELEIV